MNRRWCINALPMCTVWIALKGGLTPDEEKQLTFDRAAAIIAALKEANK